MLRRFITIPVLVFLAIFATDMSQAQDSPTPSAAATVYLPLVVNPDADLQVPTPANDFKLSPDAQAVIDLTNEFRVANGCAPLVANAKLTASAQRHSQDMALNNFFSHTGGDGSSVAARITATDYHWRTVGENIAAGYSSAESVVQGWMESAGHRANILNCAFEDIGIGYYDQTNDQPNVRLTDGSVSGPFRHYWTQDFGTVQ